jgi:Tol biopolymer transport system component
MNKKISIAALGVLFVFVAATNAQRVPVLNQIDLPHNYYFRELYLPQLTSGPSSVAWTTDGASLVYSMSGSLWLYSLGTKQSEQLTDGDGYDYQPDVDRSGEHVVFVRYNGESAELMVLNLKSRVEMAITSNKAVNLEPRWSPNGSRMVFVSTVNSGHFLLHSGDFLNNELVNVKCLTPDQKSTVKR